VALCPKNINGFKFTALGLRLHTAKVHKKTSTPAARASAATQARINAGAFGAAPLTQEPTKADWAWADKQPFAGIVAPAGARTRRKLIATHVNTLRACCNMLWPGMQRGERAAWWLHFALPRLVFACQPDVESHGPKALGDLFLAGKFELLYDLALAREEKLRSMRVEQKSGSSRQVADATSRLIKIGEYSRAMKRCSSRDGQRDADVEVMRQLQELNPTSGAIRADHLVEFRAKAAELVASKTVDDHLMLDSQSLAAAIRLAPRGSAGSGTGWVFEHYKALVSGCNEQLEELLHSVQLLVSGKLSAEITEALGSCTLVALAKPDGGTRPIAIGEVLRRLAGKAICYQLRNPMRSFFFPAQYGVQTRGGCEQIIHTIRAHHRLFPDDVLVRLDCRNAFNCVSRTAFLTALQNSDTFRAIFPFVAQFYLPTCPLYVTGQDGSVFGTIPSTSGTQQGDPLGPFLFALAIHSCITEVLAERGDDPTSDLSMRLAVLGYLDDIHIVGPAADVAKAFELFKAKLGAVDLELSGPTAKRPTGKNLVWARNQAEIDSFVNSLDASSVPLITTCPSGFIVLGVPYGPYAAEAMLELVTDENGTNTLAHKLAGLDVLLEAKLGYEAWLLLLFCAAPSVGYAQRCAPPSETLAMAAVADKMLRGHGARICSLPADCFDNDRVKGQFHLSNKKGGPGIRSAVAANNYAYSASFADFGVECCKRWPHIQPAFAEAQLAASTCTSNTEEISLSLDDNDEPAHPAWIQDLVAQRKHILSNYENTDVLLADCSFTTRIAKDPFKHQKLFAEADSVWRRSQLDNLVSAEIDDARVKNADNNALLRHAAWWKETKSVGRCSWSCAPTANLRYYLSPSELEFSMRRLLRLPIRGLIAGARCRCGTAIDPFGDHPDTCSLLQGQRGHRHDRVNKLAVHALARQAGLSAELEKPHLNEDDNGRPADTLVPYGLEDTFGNRMVCYDVVGVGSSVAQYLEAACNGIGSAMDFGVKRKLRNARRLADDKVVVPMPYTSQGALHSNFRVSFEQWAGHWATLGDGRDADAQRMLVRIWLTQASAVVQKAQFVLTGRLVGQMQAVNSKTGQLIPSLLPVQLFGLQAQRVLEVPSF